MKVNAVRFVLSFLACGTVIPPRWVVAEPTDSSGEVGFPPLLDPDDVAYFFANDDLDGLHWALTNVFQRSLRNPNATRRGGEQLPATLVARGGGSTYTTAYKLQHDLEQALYLAETLADPEQAYFFQHTVVPKYREVLDRIPPLESLTRTGGLYPFSPDDVDTVGSIYNKAWHQANVHESLPLDAQGRPKPLLNPNLQLNSLQQQWLGIPTKSSDNRPHPGILVVDDVLTESALQAIRRILWDSTIWYQTKLPLQFGGYVGAYIDDGLHDRLLLQLARELARALPRIFESHPLRYLWAYKYDSNYTGINLHADQAAVNVNLWVTPDEANLDPTSGGLVVFTAKPDATMDFTAYNTNTQAVVEQLLAPTDFANVTIPYRSNRMVLFDSALFHQTDTFRFRKGYRNRRINLTFLYGTMQLERAELSSADTEL
jgi:hypothetical protein